MRSNLDDIYRKMQWNPSPFLIYTHNKLFGFRERINPRSCRT